MEYLGTIRLGYDHNLIIPNAPPVVNLEEVVSKHNKGMDFAKMGFWDSSSPNFETYYPDATPEDLKPKDEEFITPIYRALSEVIVHKDYNPIDFSQNNALKNSTGLLVGQTVYPNHESLVGNELGAVSDAKWEKAYKTESGILVPAGINAKLKIDGKSHPNVARKIQMDPPAIHSTSVTVQFLWDKSHPNESVEDFWRKLGSFDSDGVMYRRIVTKIKRYTEISFVAHGADPYAQKVNEKGEIVNPNDADVRNNKEKFAEKQKNFFFSFREELISNAEEDTIPPTPIKEDSPQSKNTNMNKAFLVALAAVMGLKGEEYSEDKLTEDIIKNKLQEMAATGSTNSTELVRLRAIETEYNKIKDNPTTDAATSAKLTELTSFRENLEKGLRTEVLAMKVKLSADGKVSDAISEMINSGGYQVLVGLREQYQVELDAKYPTSCKSCGSKDVSRASSQMAEDEETENSGGNDEEAKKPTKNSLSELIRSKKHSSNIPMGGKQPAEEKK